MQLTGQTEDQMRDMYRGEASNNLKTELVIEEIIKAEGITTDEKDVETMLNEYAKAMNKTPEAIKAEFNESQKAYFEHRSKINKVLDMLWDSAKVTDEKPEAEEAETEKPAMKKAAAKPKAEKAKTAKKEVSETDKADEEA